MREPSTALRVEVLGPLRVLDADGHDVTPGGMLPRRLLALLVLRRGQVLSVDAAVDALWPTERPDDPVAALQNHVYRLRSALPRDVIASVADGYRVDPATLDVDVDRLSTAVSTDLAADPSGLDVVRTVLDRWRGPAYPELADADDGRAESARLDELRTRAREALAAARIASGEAAAVVADLSELCDDEPLRERPRSLLMAALAATGRQADALRVYDDFRRLIGDELGIDPSAALVDQHAALLDGAPSTAWSMPRRIPAPVTSLVGRDALAAEIMDAASRERLVTLVGPGGVGKTRLLLELGRRATADRDDRATVMCELAIADVDTAIDVVAAAMGIDSRPGVDLTTRIVDVVGQTELVVLLDNCEHVLDVVAGLVERLLSGCPRVTIIATSRERIRVPGEHVRVVPPLPTEDEWSPAVQLFVERARAVVADFDPGEADRQRITDIVRRLDGLPLAIELAAARLHTHDVAEVAAGIDQRFVLLTSGSRTSTRHGSLAAAVEWSFGLLDEHLQRVFVQLSVFSGPFDTADAAAVCGVDVDAIAPALAHLVERSLVMRSAAHRYVLLETLRAFGVDRLRRDGITDEVGERHARYFVDWIEAADRGLGQPSGRTLVEIDAALPELRNALLWLLDHGDVEAAGRLVSASWMYSFMRLRPDVYAWSERVLAADPNDESRWAPQVWVVAAYASWTAGDIPTTGARGDHAHGIVEARGEEVPAMVSTIRGSHALFEGRLDDAARWYGIAAARAEGESEVVHVMALGSELLALGYQTSPTAESAAEDLVALIDGRRTPHAAYAWYCAGEAALALGDPGLARERFQHALDLAEETHASFVTGLAGTSKASIDTRHGDVLAAANDYRWLIPHWRRAGMWSAQWTMLRSIALLFDRVGRHHDAAVIESAVRATEEGHRLFGADAVAMDELNERLRTELGDDGYDAARRQGSVLDGDTATEFALRVLHDMDPNRSGPDGAGSDGMDAPHR